jgi:DNA-binding GntR family transcriptional regulator
MTRDDDEFERKFAPRTLPEQVAEELGAEIVAGRRKSGERLIELELAQCFGVSRGPIREAIRILERRRLVDFNPRRGAYVRPLSLKSVADLFDVRIALSLLAARTMATVPVESYIDTFGRRCAELDAMVDDGDPIAFARVMTRAVRTVAHGSGNELLAEQLADLANQTVWATIWKAPLDYQTREIRREAADLMRSTLDAIHRRDAAAAVTSQRKLLEDDRDRALASLSRIMAAAADFGVFSREDTGKSEVLANSAA